MSHASGSDPITRAISVDIVALALVGIWVLIPPQYSGFGGVGQMVLGLVAVLFAPGYALVAALFPREGRGGRYFESDWSATARSEEVESVEPTKMERFLLAVGMSVCLVSLLGLGLNFTAWGVTRWSLQTAVGGTTLVFTAVAVVQRWRIPPGNRFALSLGLPLFPELADGIAPGQAVETRQFALAALLVLATLGVGFAAWHPLSAQSEQFTEFYVQAPQGGATSGDLVAGDYPTNLPSSAGDRVYLGITNQEGERKNYTVVIQAHRFQRTGEERTIVSRSRIDRFSASVPTGETEQFRYTVEREISNEGYRLTFLLYAGELPDDPTVDNAYRQVHIWVGDDRS